MKVDGSKRTSIERTSIIIIRESSAQLLKWCHYWYCWKASLIPSLETHRSSPVFRFFFNMNTSITADRCLAVP